MPFQDPSRWLRVSLVALAFGTATHAHAQDRTRATATSSDVAGGSEQITVTGWRLRELAEVSSTASR
jgi:hypothetical protein